MSNKLKIRYDKRKKDIVGQTTFYATDKTDIYLMFYHLLYLKEREEKNCLIEELQDRGYDIRTLNFSIEKQSKEDNFKFNKVFSFKENIKDLIMFKLRGYGWEINDYDENHISFIKIRKNGNQIVDIKVEVKNKFAITSFENAKLTTEQLRIFANLEDLLKVEGIDIILIEEIMDEIDNYQS